MKPGALKIAKQTAQRNWYKFVQRTAELRQRQTQYQESNGVYQGYDADTGKAEIKLLDGKTIYADSITNAGQLKGDRVAVSGNRKKLFKTMPR
jgi:hypothetical protein